MRYTIREASQRTGFSAYTLRYYERQKILPPVARDAAGNRTYSEEDIQLLEMIRCLKNIALCKQGDGTLEQRRQMLLTHQAHVEAKIEQMRQELEHIQAKLNYYDRACGQAVRPADSCGGR